MGAGPDGDTERYLEEVADLACDIEKVCLGKPLIKAQEALMCVLHELHCHAVEQGKAHGVKPHQPLGITISTLLRMAQKEGHVSQSESPIIPLTTLS